MTVNPPITVTFKPALQRFVKSSYNQFHVNPTKPYSRRNYVTDGRKLPPRKTFLFLTKSITTCGPAYTRNTLHSRPRTEEQVA